MDIKNLIVGDRLWYQRKYVIVTKIHNKKVTIRYVYANNYTGVYKCVFPKSLKKERQV